MKNREESDRERERLLGNIPAHRYGTVEEAADAAAFLLIGQSEYINGAAITIDGGFTATPLSLGTCRCCVAQTTLCCSSARIGTRTGVAGHRVSRLI
jgi:hypothetical protein